MIYNDSKIASKVSCGRRKSKAIVMNVLGRKSLDDFINYLKLLDPPLFFALQIYASNHKNMKMFPVCVQYFNIETGTVNYVIDFFEN